MDQKFAFTTLQQRLDALRKAEEQSLPAEAFAELNKQKQELAESDLIFNSAKVGDYVQNFVLPDGAGRRAELKRLLKKGPVVLVFFRGNWCDYCKLQLSALHNAYPHVKAAGGQLVAISPQNLDQTLAAYEANSSLFNVLSDMGNVVARRFGITFRMSANLMKVYKKFWKIDLSKYYDADDTDIIPAPATFVIDVTGQITFAFVNPDYTKRASLTDVIQAVRASRHPSLNDPHQPHHHSAGNTQHYYPDGSGGGDKDEKCSIM